ncbi:MAG: hypothetical protein P8Y42_21185 [Exilibacterium sp.]
MFFVESEISIQEKNGKICLTKSGRSNRVEPPSTFSVLLSRGTHQALQMLPSGDCVQFLYVRIFHTSTRGAADKLTEALSNAFDIAVLLNKINPYTHKNAIELLLYSSRFKTKEQILRGKYQVNKILFTPCLRDYVIRVDFQHTLSAPPKEPSSQDSFKLLKKIRLPPDSLVHEESRNIQTQVSARLDSASRFLKLQR